MTVTFPPFSPTRGMLAVFLAWFISQAIKVIRGVWTQRKFNFRWLFDTGGMPSSHSASVAALATTAGLYYGFRSMPFLITLVFTIIIMFDAAGPRRAAGRQAAVLNKMIDDLYQRGQVPEQRLRELLGHTPVEVFTGAFMGILTSLVLCR